MGCGASSLNVQVRQQDPLYKWLHNIYLEMYYDKLVSNGYDHLDFLFAAYKEDLEELIITIGMSENHKEIFIQNLIPVIILATPVL
tara:strand:- start:3452 stop:3709 length:258 start_codon:yes stop_codon:yes gene_type:complete